MLRLAIAWVGSFACKSANDRLFEYVFGGTEWVGDRGSTFVPKVGVPALIGQTGDDGLARGEGEAVGTLRNGGATYPMGLGPMKGKCVPDEE